MSRDPQYLAKEIRQHQDRLLKKSERFFDDGPIPDRIRAAFRAAPRHLFVPRFYSSTCARWVRWQDEGLEKHLDELYQDHPLGIHFDANGRIVSTISQPSLVLLMLDLLDLKPGMKVYELGGGSGWNAAMLGKLVGPEGHVTSIELIEDLVEPAQQALRSLGIQNVDFLAGDGSHGRSEKAPYQRGVFTASAWDLPPCFFRQIENGGLLELVIKVCPHVDLLTVLRKIDDRRFVSEYHFSCSFVPVLGSHAVPDFQARPWDDLPLLKGQEKKDFQFLDWNELGIGQRKRSRAAEFLRIVYDCQQSCLCDFEKLGEPEEYWLASHPHLDGLALFNEEGCYLSNDKALAARLKAELELWELHGEPLLEELDLSIATIDSKPEGALGQWFASRGECVLIWSIRQGD